MTTFTWVIGSGGLLGQALLRRGAARPGAVIIPAHLPWSNPRELVSAATAEFSALLDLADGQDWAIVWAAGATVTSSSAIEFGKELEQLRAVLEAFDTVLAARPSRGRGAFFYASSAGGVYGGSADPPFTETTTVSPISDYGRFKLSAEAEVTRFGNANGLAVMLGRIANLYGPGQRLDKTQGLISQVARAGLSARPAAIFVPLETVRDYLYVDDCADMILDAIDKLHRLGAEPAPSHVVKIFASGQGTTIASLLGYFRAIGKSRPNVMVATSALSSLQAIDLRLRSTVWTELDRRDLTPLPVGIHATVRGILQHIQDAK